MDVKVKIEFQISLNSLETVGEVKEYICNNLNRVSNLPVYKDEIKIQDIWSKNKEWR